MHQPFEPRPPLEELLQNLAVWSADGQPPTGDRLLARHRQIHAMMAHIQQSPELWRPMRLPDPVYSDRLAALYNEISQNPHVIPLIGSMDWLNAQLKSAFDIN